MSDNWKEVVAKWQGGIDFLGRNPKGATVRMGPQDQDGALSVGPMEMLLLGLAGCTGMDVISILEKKRQVVQRFEVKVRGQRATTYPMVYTEIEVIYLFWGDDLDPKAVEQAIALSEEKYCSASAMMRSAAELRSSYQIMPVEERLEAK